MSEAEESATSIRIRRPVYKQKSFDDEFKLATSKASPSSEGEEDESRWKDRCSSLGHKALGCLHPMKIVNLFTIFNLIASYDFKKTLVADLLSGLTVGVMHIPAALAYGALTSLNPVNGLYTSFYPGIMYVLFGTSKHLSVGTFAITSLMVYSTVNRLESEYTPLLVKTVVENMTQPLSANQSDDGVTMAMFLSTNPNITQSLKMFANESDGSVLVDEENALMSLKIKIASSLAFWCGIVQVVMAILRIGNITKYFSQSLLRGFTTAAAFHVVTTQLQHVFGIYHRSQKRRKFLKLFYTYLRIFQKISTINFVAFGMSVASIIALLVVKIHISERFKKQLRNIPIPMELIIIVTSIVVTHFANLNTEYGLAVVGEIPNGMPGFQLPDFSMFFDLFQDALIIAVVAFATSVSVADMFARKHKYQIDPNREIFALGMANVVGSFFHCFTSCGALARSAVQDSSGGRTQLVTIIASGIIMATLLYIAPLLQMLPKAILGAIIIAALYNLFKQLSDLKHYWKIDKIDFLIWIITFGSSILLDIDLGLLIGIITVLFLNTYRTQNLELNVLGQVNGSDIFSNVEKYSTNQYDDIRIVRPTHSIFYINSDKFRSDLHDLCPLKDREIDQTLCQECFKNYGCVLCCAKKPNDDDEGEAKKAETEIKLETDQNNADQSLFLDAPNSSTLSVKYFKVIILDCTQVQFIDEATVKMLKEVIAEYKKEGVKFFMTNCNDGMLKFLRKSRNFPDPFGEIIYLKNQDAIAASRQ